ncbi:MAG: hypothetical protein MJ181_01730 [Treponema sp.]|nr:hypothetical protein [Treponema sp.]
MYNEKGVYPDTVPLKRNDKAPIAGNYSYFFIKPKTNDWQELEKLEKQAGEHGAVLALPTKRGLLITIANSDDQHFSEVYKNHKIIDITKDIGAFQDKNPNASINYVLTNVLKEDERNLDFEININQLGYNPEEIRKNKLEKERIIRETLKEEEQIDSRYGKIAISTALKSNWFVANEFADTAARNLTMNEADIIAKKMQNEKPNEGWKVYNEDLEEELEIQHVLNDFEDIEKTTNSKKNTYGKNETENPFPLQEENDLLQNENTEKEEKVIINNLNNEQKKMSYESSTENILQLGNTIGLLKDNFSGNKSQEAINQLEKLKSNEELTAEDFLSEIQNIMHISEEKSHTVRHYIDTEQYNLRISNHSANAIHAKYRPNETSIVIKLSSTHFHGDKNSYLAEYVYNSKNLSKEKQNGILNGLQDWLQTGYFTDKTYDKEFYSPNKELYLEQINTNQTKLLKANIKELNLKNKEINIWVEKAEKDNKRITELSNQDKEQKEIIKKQNQLLYGQCSIKVNGQDREIKKGLLNAFPNAVIKLDEANQKIQDLSQNKSINKKLNNSNGIEM